MKIEACPAACAFAEPDYTNYDSDKEQTREAAHEAQLKGWLRSNGWNGPRTGEMLSVQMADGYANYMYADGNRPKLIHLPYGDGYHQSMVEYLPKKKVLELLDRSKSMTALFGAKT